MKRKKAIAMSFNWIFAIIAGGFILFLAIYGAGKFIQTSEQATYTETAASLSSLFDPLETGLASGKAHVINFKKNSKIFFDCNARINPPFGKQYISFSEQTLGDKYGEEGGKVSIINKYLFADDVVEGKSIYVFSKPFFMPFKVADMTMVISGSEKYCFYDAPEKVREDLESLNLKSIIFMNATNKCEGIDICFNRNNCDIVVDEANKRVKSNINGGEKMYYTGDMIYAAIFSHPYIYECNVKRLKNKFNEVAKIYIEKINIMERQGCMPTIGEKLRALVDKDIQNSKDILEFNRAIEDIDSINRLSNAGCMLYYNNNWGR
jgi:hypothetical protein